MGAYKCVTIYVNSIPFRTIIAAYDLRCGSKEEARVRP